MKTLSVFRVEYFTITFKDNVEVNGGRGPRQTRLVAAGSADQAMKMIPRPEQKADGTEIRNNFIGTRTMLPNVLVEG